AGRGPGHAPPARRRPRRGSRRASSTRSSRARETATPSDLRPRRWGRRSLAGTEVASGDGGRRWGRRSLAGTEVACRWGRRLPVGTEVALFAVAFGFMLVEARRAAANERAQRARGGVEPSGDVYGLMQVAYPASFLLMLAEGVWR